LSWHFVKKERGKIKRIQYGYSWRTIISQNLKKNNSEVEFGHTGRNDRNLRCKITKVKAWNEMQLSKSIIENVMVP